MKLEMPKEWLINPQKTKKEVFADFGMALLFMIPLLFAVSFIIRMMTKNWLLSFAIAEGIFLLGYVFSICNSDD
jgi:hypothetical protein